MKDFPFDPKDEGGVPSIRLLILGVLEDEANRLDRIDNDPGIRGSPRLRPRREDEDEDNVVLLIGIVVRGFRRSIITLSIPGGDGGLGYLWRKRMKKDVMISRDVSSVPVWILVCVNPQRWILR